MRIGVLSDTHDQFQRTTRAITRLQDAGATHLIHCGDLTSPLIVASCSVLPCTFVAGNCDHDLSLLEAAAGTFGAQFLGRGGTIELEGTQIAVTHGHDGRLIKDLQGCGAAYLFTGHTHQRRDETLGVTRWINPGALHRASEYSVVILDLRNNLIEWMNVD